MELIDKTTHEGQPTIEISENHSFCQQWLTQSPWFSPFTTPAWEWSAPLSLTIEAQQVVLQFESPFSTLLIFEQAALRDEVFTWLSENDLSSPEYWEEKAQPILAQLQSGDLPSIQQGLAALKNWVTAYNDTSVDDSRHQVDLSIFGYEEDLYEEGDLWPNPLFDELLTQHQHALLEEDLFHVIASLFNKNEEYADCKATYTAITLLLKNPSPAIETRLVELTLDALEGHEPGHRSYEQGLLDRLVDDIFPTFSATALVKLLTNLEPDNLYGEHYGGQGDNFIGLAPIALEKNPTEEEKAALEGLIEQYR